MHLYVSGFSYKYGINKNISDLTDYLYDVYR